MSRLTPEREAVIRQRISEGEFDFQSGYMESVIAEIDALRRERDEAIVGAYRANLKLADKWAGWAGEPSEAARGCGNTDDERDEASNDAYRECSKELRALTPQSALDAVERDRREIAETALQEMNEWCNFIPKPRKRLCRAWVNSDCGREYCQGFSGHKMHWYKIWSTGEVIYWAARGRIRGGKR